MMAAKLSTIVAMAGLVVPAASFTLRAPARSAGTRSMARSQLKMDLPERTKKATLTVPSNIGVGTLAWGDPRRGFGETYNAGDIMGAYNTLVEGGVTFFDTAEVYGYQSMKQEMSSEQLLGNFADTNYKYTPMIATKYMPVLWANKLVGGGFRGGRRAVVNALEASLERMGRSYVDVYQVHFPFPYIGGNKALYEGLARCHERGLCNGVGVSNFNAKQVEVAYRELEKRGVPLVSNQVELSLCNQKALEDGTIDKCKRLGVTVLAHTPLAGGLATAKYTAMNPTGGKLGAKGKFRFETLQKFGPMHAALQTVAKRAGAREDMKITPTQVALNWVVAKGAVPLPGVRNTRDAEEVVGAVGWRLRAEDLELIDSAVEQGMAAPAKTKKANPMADRW
mmetsp:Transcript_31230/g.82720  ORF Transcript_31230/g.82720 Transcript_31230/m.82720 type:complete len:394 (-) Transcript_31230:286-1467(-)